MAGGYGRLSFRGKHTLAHRVVYQLLRGPIPEGCDVCHHCDNPPCVNPDHLYTGDARSNIEDCIAKGRMNRPKGNKHPQAKLNDEAVRDILGNCRPKVKGASMKFYAEKYSVSDSLVEFIMKRTAWKHVAI